MPTPEQTAKLMTYDPAFAIGENVRDMMAAHIAHAIKAERSERQQLLMEAAKEALSTLDAVRHVIVPGAVACAIADARQALLNGLNE